MRAGYEERRRVGGVRRARSARAAWRRALHVARGSWRRWRRHAAEAGCVACAVALVSLAAGGGEHGGAAGNAACGAVDGAVDGQAAQHAKEVSASWWARSRAGCASSRGDRPYQM